MEDEIRRLAFSCLKRVNLMGKKGRLVGVRVSNLKKIAIVSPPV
jgi:DNA polymerase-4